MVNRIWPRLLSYLWWGAFCAVASAPAAEPIHWRSGTLQAISQAPEQVAHEIETLAERLAARHLVIQFSERVTQERNGRLADAGLHLLAYLGSNAYFAALSPEKFDAKALAALPSLVHAAEIEMDLKLHPRLAGRVPPAWAIIDRTNPGDPTVACYVLLHADVALNPHGRQVAAQHGALVRSDLFTVNGLVIEIPYSRVRGLAADDAVQWVEPALPPLSGVNDGNRTLVQADVVQAPPYGLNGAGVTAMVYDAGTGRASHQDFGGRLTVRDNSGLDNHATHVAGTIGGNGAASGGIWRGMAPGVVLESYGFQYDGQGIFLYTNPGDLEEDYNQAINVHGADIANNSIGTNIVVNGFDCDLMGDYGVTDRVIDSVVRGSLGQPFRVVWAVGNERQAPATCGTAYGTLAPPACAKNHITVGALNSNDDTMTGFSSWGPTDDGRMKPDVSAPGCQVGDDGGVTSCSSSSDTGYAVICGTSMAAPTVTGCLALLLQDFRVQFPFRPDPRNSTLKVLLAQTAVDLGNTGPDYQFGFGSVRIRDSIDLMRAGNFLEAQLGQGEVHSIEVLVQAGAAPLKVSLAWDDWPGTPNVVPSLVNDLDLRLIAPDNTVHFPWVLDPVNPASPATQNGPDHRNTIEQVVVQSPQVGYWRAEVVGFDVPLFPQAFSVCASHPIPALQLTEAISRSYTVVNMTGGPPPFVEAVSRSYTVANFTAGPPPYTEALSRAYTVANLTSGPPPFSESISRAWTVLNLSGHGDVNGDGSLDGLDIRFFVGVFLGTDTNPSHVAASDMDCNGIIDSVDLTLFVDVLLLS